MINLKKEFNPELLLPLYNPEVDVNSELCARAHKKLREGMRKSDTNIMSEGLQLYREAYDSGIQEAAVNALALCISVAIHNTLVKGTTFAPPKNLIEEFTGRLCAINHPIGRYYLALSLIYGFYERRPLENESEFGFDTGWSLMLTFADQSNEYAENFVNFSVDFFLQTVPLGKGETMWILPPPIQVWGGLIYKIWE